jgi:hypothetical protein
MWRGDHGSPARDIWKHNSSSRRSSMKRGMADGTSKMGVNYWQVLLPVTATGTKQ